MSAHASHLGTVRVTCVSRDERGDSLEGDHFGRHSYKRVFDPSKQELEHFELFPSHVTDDRKKQRSRPVTL